MVCPSCKDAEHEKCKGGSWCDCQHDPQRPTNVARV